MSDTQDNLVLRQRQMQQRQILAMMGIEQWVWPDSLTIKMDSIAAVEESSQLTVQQPVSADTMTDEALTYPANTYHDEQSTKIAKQDSPTVISDIVVSDRDDHSLASTVAIHDTEQQADIYDSMPKVTECLEPLVETFSTQLIIDSQLTVSPFDLQGGRYGDWVLIVDIKALNSDSQKLWQNINQALSISCETSSFPICAGMDTAELANASLAGYIFKLARREDIQVAALTVLPDGLEHPNFIVVPTLDEMLADSALKHDFWQQLSKPA